MSATVALRGSRAYGVNPYRPLFPTPRRDYQENPIASTTRKISGPQCYLVSLVLQCLDKHRVHSRAWMRPFAQAVENVTNLLLLISRFSKPPTLRSQPESASFLGS